MNILAQPKISTKILILPLMLGAVTIAIAFMESRELRTVNAAYAAMVEQTSAAARNLTQEVGSLANAAAQFNAGLRGVDAGGKQNVPAARCAAPRPIVVEATRAPALRLLPTAKPSRKDFANDHTNGHAKGAAANNEWSDF